MTPAPRFELGCNYWPRRSALWMWRELDLGAIRDEMAQIRGLGCTVVRWFVLAEDFLPGPLEVDRARLRDLVAVAGAVRDAGLRQIPTLVTINMSGRSFWPAWMRDERGLPRDLYGDPVLLRAQARLCQACAGALRGDASLRAFDLANEIDDAQPPRSWDAGWLWVALLAGAVRRAAPGVPIQLGCHLPNLTAAPRLRLDDVGALCDEDCIHAYPLYSPFARGPLDPELVPFSCALTAELAGQGRAPLMHELGVCTAPPGEPGRRFVDDFLGQPLDQYLASEEEAAGYYQDVLARLVAMGAAGAYAWCYADYDPRLFDRPPLSTALRERSFGLVRADGSEKPAAAVVRALARRLEEGTEALGSRPAPRLLDLSADAYYAAPAAHFGRLYRKWLAERAA